MGKYRVKLEFEYEIDVPEVNVGDKYEDVINELTDEQYNTISSAVHEIMTSENCVDGIVSIDAIENNYIVDEAEVYKWLYSSISNDILEMTQSQKLEIFSHSKTEILM